MLLGTTPKTGEAYAAVPERPYHGKTMLVGLVLPRGCVPEKPCTASFVTNPQSIPDTPDMVVEEARVPEARDGHRHATMQRQIVASKQAKPQPGNRGGTFTPTGADEAAAPTQS